MRGLGDGPRLASGRHPPGQRRVGVLGQEAAGLPRAPGGDRGRPRRRGRRLASRPAASLPAGVGGVHRGGGAGRRRRAHGHRRAVGPEHGDRAVFARQLGGVARYESEHRSERLRAKLEQNAHRGVTHGRPTYGWRGGYDEHRTRRDVLDPTEAEVVRGIARDILAGKSIRSITKNLNERGVPSPRGGEWQKGMVRHLVLRPRNAGIRVHRGQEIGEGTWEPLLDRGTFEQVRAVLADPARRTSVGTAAAHLLSGIARCGVCGASMRFAMNRTVPSYRCSGRSCVSRRAEDVDWLVTEVVLGRLARPDAADLLAPFRRPERAQAAEEARSLRARLDTAADDYADGKIDARQLERITARLRPKLTDAEERARVVDDSALLDGLIGQERAREAWLTRTLAQQRAIVDALVTVTVLPTRQGARGFDPRSVHILWRSG